MDAGCQIRLRAARYPRGLAAATAMRSTNHRVAAGGGLAAEAAPIAPFLAISQPVVNYLGRSGEFAKEAFDSGESGQGTRRTVADKSAGSLPCAVLVDREGNVALLFAFALIPIIGSMGVALDHSVASAVSRRHPKVARRNRARLTRIMPADQATLDTVGNQYFNANLGPHQIDNLQLTVTPELGKLKLSATGTYKPQLAHVIGVTSVALGTKSEARWSIGKVEIALVLDNSWSMNSLGRMTQLKNAAHNLLDVLQTAAKTPGDAKVAIIPFDARVNVGTGNVSATWIKWNVSTSSNGVCSNSQYLERNPCQDNGHTWTATNGGNWPGCVWDRDKSNDTLDAAPTDSATNYPAWQCAHGLPNPNLVSQMLPLTTNWGTSGSADASTLHGKVNQMQPAGYTNITIGLVWGWHALSDTAVMTDGAANNTDNLQKYIILLTDGENTRNRFGDSEFR